MDKGQPLILSLLPPLITMVLLFGTKESEEGDRFPRKKLIFRKVKSFDKIISNAKKKK